jgi:hypothetical protein
MNENRAAQLARLTPDQLNRYQRLKTIAITLGFLSLFSFWIMVALNEALPPHVYGGKFGNLLRLMEWAQAGFVLAMCAFVAAMFLRGIARKIRLGADLDSTSGNRDASKETQ